MESLKQKYSIVDLRRSFGDEEQVSLEIVSMRPEEFQLLRNRNFYRYGFTTQSPNATSGYMGYNMLQFRIDVDRFKLRKKQSKILRQFDRFLQARKIENAQEKKSRKKSSTLRHGFDQSEQQIKNRNIRIDQLKLALEQTLESMKNDAEHPVDLAPFGVKIFGEMQGVKCIFMDKSHVGLFEEKLLCSFVAQLSHNLADENLKSETQPSFEFGHDDSSGHKKSKQAKNKFQSHLLGISVTFENRVFKIELLYNAGEESMQEAPHSSESNFDSRSQMEQKIRLYFGVKDSAERMDFKIKIESPAVTQEKFDLYAKYMKEIHGHSFAQKGGMERTWCQEPFISQKMGFSEQVRQKNGIGNLEGIEEFPDVNLTPEDLNFGNKHMCFYINGKLVGVAVVDVCPTIICSLYFWYDPILKPLSFGKISVTKEIKFYQLLRKVAQIDSELDDPEHLGDLFRYHNLGGFALGNGKVGYKAEFGPGELLCPVTMRYAQVGYIDRSLKIAIDQATEEVSKKDKSDNSEQKHEETYPEELGAKDIEEEDEMIDEVEEIHINTLKKLLTDKSDLPLKDRKIFEGEPDTLLNEEFGLSGIFGDQDSSSFQDLESFLKSNLLISLEGGILKASQIPEKTLGIIISRYEWVFRAIGKTALKSFVFKL